MELGFPSDPLCRKDHCEHRSVPPIWRKYFSSTDSERRRHSRRQGGDASLQFRKAQLRWVLHWSGESGWPKAACIGDRMQRGAVARIMTTRLQFLSFSVVQ